MKLSTPIYSLILALFVFYACDAAHHITKMNEHKAKAEQNGAIFKDSLRTVEVEIEVPGPAGKDSTILVEVEVPCPEVETPPTRWEVRFDYKRFKKELKHARKLIEDSTQFILDSMELENERLDDSLKRMKPLIKYEERTERAISRHNSYGFFEYLLLIIIFIAGYAVRHFFGPLKRE